MKHLIVLISLVIFCCGCDSTKPKFQYGQCVSWQLAPAFYQNVCKGATFTVVRLLHGDIWSDDRYLIATDVDHEAQGCPSAFGADEKDLTLVKCL